MDSISKHLGSFGGASLTASITPSGLNQWSTDESSPNWAFDPAAWYPIATVEHEYAGSRAIALLMVESPTGSSGGWTMRDVCHLLVNRLPEPAFPELFDTLGGMLEFYSSKHSELEQQPALGATLKAVRGATVEAPVITLGDE